MSEERLIAIVSIPKNWVDVDISQLPKMRVETTDKDNYSFPSTEVIKIALLEMLKSVDTQTLSAIFMVIDIAKERKRRRRRGGAVK